MRGLSGHRFGSWIVLVSHCFLRRLPLRPSVRATFKHYVRVRLGGLTIWRLQCTTCHAVFTVLPHFVLRYRSMRPEVARNALLATHGGLSLELCAVICHISPMALYRLVCAFAIRGW